MFQVRLRRVVIGHRCDIIYIIFGAFIKGVTSQPCMCVCMCTPVPVPVPTHNDYSEVYLHSVENCLDRHVEKNPDKPAFIWEKDDPGQHEVVTYA